MAVRGVVGFSRGHYQADDSKVTEAGGGGAVGTVGISVLVPYL